MLLKNRKRVTLSLLAMGVFGTGAFWLLELVSAKPLEQKGISANPSAVYALVRVSHDDPLLSDSRQAPHSADMANELMKRNEATLIKSPWVLNDVARNEKIAAMPLLKQQPNPVAWLEKTLEVDYPNDGDILRIGMRGPEPDEISLIVNAVVDTYIQKKAQAYVDQRDRRLDQIRNACVNHEERIRKLREMLHDLKDALKSLGPNSLMNQQILAQGLQDCTRELRRVRLEKAAVQVQLGGKQAETTESKPGFKRSLEEKTAIVAEQEKLLVQEQNQMLEQARRQETPSFEIDARQQEIDQQEQVLRRLRDQMETMAVARYGPGMNVLVQRAEVPVSK